MSSAETVAAVTPGDPEPAGELWPAEDFRPLHSAYVEVGGAALVYSFNYDLRFDEAMSARAGISVLPACLFSSCIALPIVPLSIHGFAGEGAHLFEYGGGATFVLIDDDDARFLVPALGYRYQQPEGGFLFRATAMGLFRMNDESDAIPFAGLSFGYSE